MTWPTAPLGSVVEELRQVVQPESFAGGSVLHYSIPALEQTGRPVEEPADEIGSAKLLARGGEVAISKLNPRKARIVEISPSDGLPILCSTELIVLRPIRVTRRYLRWLLTSEYVRQELDGRVQSVTRSHQRVRPQELLRLPVPLPALDSQRRIADFLDAETARIDALIAKKLRIGALLSERRAAVTAAGVTGSLRNQPRRASALVWSPDLPAPWKEAKATLVARLGSGHTPSRERVDWWEDCTIPWITTGEVAQLRSDRVEYIESTRERVSELGIRNSSAEVHPAGTVVLSRTASAGFSGIMASDMATSQDYVTWTCGPLLRPRFLLLCLRAMRQDLLGRLAMGSTHKTIYMPDIESIRIPLPPVAEQDEIVEATWSELRRLGTAEDLLARQIELLIERRAALITAAVTGQIPMAA